LKTGRNVLFIYVVMAETFEAKKKNKGKEVGT
jgi:hypothetical protein